MEVIVGWMQKLSESGDGERYLAFIKGIAQWHRLRLWIYKSIASQSTFS